MSWITPKTDWKDSDYFNYEDALRISENIEYLINWGQEIYKDYDRLNMLFYRGSVFYQGSNVDYYTALDIHPKNMYLIVLYKGMIDIFSVFFNMYENLAKLNCLASFLHPSLVEEINVPTGLLSDNTTPAFYYNGYGYKRENASSLPDIGRFLTYYSYEGLYREEYTYYSSKSFYDEWYEYQYYQTGIHRNTPFWRSGRINKLEYLCANIYRLFTENFQN